MSNTENTRKDKYMNHLIDESSPYLLQHAENPVDWYPWSAEALKKARTEDKPIFLSIGYAACHWCHVMEEESFENKEIADFLNEHFISIKVDREQRPDLDQIYMAATMAISGSGGWPMSVFLTPDLNPFFAGTYFPPDDRFGRPGFKRMLQQIAEMFANDRKNIDNYADNLRNSLNDSYNISSGQIKIADNIVNTSVNQLLSRYDSRYGGFGGAPKFPHATDISFLMSRYAETDNDELLKPITHTLDAMANGGIYDQIGGGFHRYATDAGWLVPHFEKMLYDNATLAVCYAEAFQLTGNTRYKEVVTGTLDFMMRELRDSNGGMYSSLDADSEGEEGRFYVWHKDEVDNILGDDSEEFCKLYHIMPDGSFENGSNILNLTSKSINSGKLQSSDINRLKQKLFEARSKRIRPFTDDKILTSWNGLAISGFSRGYQITGDHKYKIATMDIAKFVENYLIKNGHLLHSYRDGKISERYFLEDYAYFINGLLDLYQIDFNYKWIQLASDLTEDAINLFADAYNNLYLSPDGMNDHYIRPRDVADGALPSPGSILIQAMTKLAEIKSDTKLMQTVENLLSALAGDMNRMPSGMISAVRAYDYAKSEKIEIVIIGTENRDKFLNKIYSLYIPNAVLVVSDKGDEDLELQKGRRFDGSTKIYICQNYTCQLPATTFDEFRNQLSAIGVKNVRCK